MNFQGLSFVFMMVLFSSSQLFSGCRSRQTSRQPATGTCYTCPMHRQIHANKPGNCPVCGMKLIKVTSPGKAAAMPLDTALSYLTEPVTQTVVGSFKVIEPVKAGPDDTIRADGYISFDRRDINAVNTRVTGRVEKLYVSHTNQRIHKGQPLMEIYSPELLSVQRNLLQVMADQDQKLIYSLKEQLINLGMQAAEIKMVMQNRKPLSRITIYSPCNGISRSAIIGGSMNGTTASQTGMGINESNISPGEIMAAEAAAQPAGVLNIRKGMYVNRGQTVFSIQNTDRVWAILNVFTDDIRHIHPGETVILYTDADPAHIIKGHVDFIPPYRSRDEKTTRIRIYLPTLLTGQAGGQSGGNHPPPDWKINTLIHGKIAISGQNEGVSVPLSAVNRLGMRSVVWLQDKDHANVFRARAVKTGIETGDSIQIIAGIRPGDKIVENAAYMVDSDSFIQ